MPSHPTVAEWLKNLIHILRRLSQMRSCGETRLLGPEHSWALSPLSLWLLQRGTRTLALRARAAYELLKSGAAEKLSLASSPSSLWFRV